MQLIDNSNVYQPLKLTPLQHRVLKALKGIETNRYPLSEWYCGALYTLDNPHNPDRIAQAAQSLRELLEKLPLVVQGIDTQGRTSGHVGSGFRNMRSDIEKHILEYKKRCPGEWQGQKIDNHLAKALRIVEDYLERNKQPDRKEKIKKAVTSIDPMADRFDSQIRERKRDRLHRLWRRLEDFAHHSRKLNTESFKTCLEELEATVFDLLAPITAENQRAIQTILNCADRSDTDIERMFLLIERRGANYVFFFKQAAETADTAWLFHLDKRGYLANPPNAEPTGEGGINYPYWWPIHYLAKIAKQAPDAVIEIVLKLNKVENPTVYQEILNIALALHGERSTKLKPKILESLKLEHRVWAYHYADLLAHWTKENQAAAALELSRMLVAFAPDLESEAKQGRRKENPPDFGTVWETALEPSPRIGSWEYNRIMSKGVRPLSEKVPYQVALILIDATADMIHLRTHQDDLVKKIDFSDAWCERLCGSESDNVDSKKALVHTLTFACEQVYQKSLDAVDCLDDALRNQPWKIFKRLRQHLCARYPSGQTKPWIREMILGHEGYDRSEHGYEFQQMIRTAYEHFGPTLLTQAELTRIFDGIQRGPSKANYQTWIVGVLGEEFTEERFKDRQRRFHCAQFKPFERVLFGEYVSNYQELDNEPKEAISDEDYPPFKIRSGHSYPRSPRPPEDLAKFTDEELIAYINEWDEKRERFEDNNLIEEDIEGLAVTFQTVFEEQIIPDSERLRFWMENRDRIEHTRYAQAMMNGMRDQVEASNLENLNKWLEFGDWLLLNPAHNLDETNEPPDDPYSYSSREIVGNFIGACLTKAEDLPVYVRGHIANLLDTLCIQVDRHLDQGEEDNPNESNLIDAAINNPRGRALQDLISFGSWLRRYDSDYEAAEVTAILEKRLGEKAELPLTLPEHAILGMNYNRILYLNKAWASEHKSDLFPTDDVPAWVAAFSSFVGYSRPLKPTFEIIQDDLDFALQYLISAKTRASSEEKQSEIFGRPSKRNSAVEKLKEGLGQHLFHYYLWGLYPLRASVPNARLSLLERYYQAVDNNRVHWSNLLNYVGRILCNTREQLDSELKDKILAFFDWRLEVGESTELKQFSFWLKADCLDAEWRLDSYSTILDFCRAEDVEIATQVDALCDMLPSHTAKVVECFTKLTKGIGENNICIYTEQAKAILQAGFKSSDDTVRQNAVNTHENLLRVGRSDLLDLHD